VSAWLLDTNVLSELRRPRPATQVVAFVEAQPLDLLFVSVVTLAEIRFGIERLNDAHRRGELIDWLTHRVRPMFDDRVLAVTEEVMFRWRMLVKEGRKVGHTFSQPDLIIAATALDRGLIVVSRDSTEFERARVPVFNPWTDAMPVTSPPIGRR
jgi:predicted nucleic acid-binding protein